MERILTCIGCPMGCKITVQLDNNKIISIKGNTCKRGEIYAESECTNPVRTITTTVRCENGEVLPVKTNKPIPKDKMFECMKIINTINVALPVSIGSVIISNILDSGADVVATNNKE